VPRSYPHSEPPSARPTTTRRPGPRPGGGKPTGNLADPSPLALQTASAEAGSRSKSRDWTPYLRTERSGFPGVNRSSIHVRESQAAAGSRAALSTHAPNPLHPSPLRGRQFVRRPSPRVRSTPPRPWCRQHHRKRSPKGDARTPWCFSFDHGGPRSDTNENVSASTRRDCSTPEVDHCSMPLHPCAGRVASNTHAAPAQTRIRAFRHERNRRRSVAQKPPLQALKTPASQYASS